MVMGLAASALSVVACGATGESDDDVIDSLDPNTEKDDGIARPVGTFNAELAFARLGFEKVALMTDKSFHREHRVMCDRPPCPPFATNGKYKFTKSRGTNYIRFNDASGAPLDRFAYRMSGRDALELRAVGSRSWHKFKKADVAWCDEARDCKLQKLVSLLTCVGDWACNSNACSFDCGTTPAPGPVCSDVSGPCLMNALACRNGYKVVDGDVTCDCCDDAPPDPNPCVKTGCSGQICADQPMFSTCEWRPEYACYRNATCERQTDGTCGWTNTPGLRSCLGSN
ncbi:MAG: hypothetical protein HYY84_14035 [Deltaproteobacteria bacterium]|nr:hypothetical protein [Deltaproteobacteria bacterium]